MTACEADWDETWVLRTEDGRLEATVAAFGATLVSLRVADARGVLEDVLLGHSRDVAAVRAAVADPARAHVPAGFVARDAAADRVTAINESRGTSLVAIIQSMSGLVATSF